MSRIRLRATPVGNALLIHPRGHLDQRAAEFAAGLAHDPHHTLVVVDLPTGVLANEWRSIAKVLASSRYRSLRLVFGRDRGEDARTAATLIADRLGREVLAHDDALIPTASGGLFAPGHDAAWIRFRPGQGSEPDSQRFPKPQWESALPTRARAVGLQTTAQPTASGVWLRHIDRDRLASDHRRTVETVSTDTRRLLVVLGSPGMPPLPIDDVARYWESVAPAARPCVRFYLYGTLDTPESLTPGQRLADVLDHEVVLYARLPTDASSRAGNDATLAYVPTHTSTATSAAEALSAAQAPHTTLPHPAPTPQGPSTAPDAESPDIPAATDNELGAGPTVPGVAGGSERTASEPSSTTATSTAAPTAPRTLPQPTPPRVQTVSGRVDPPTRATREVPAPQAPGEAPEPGADSTLDAAAHEPALDNDPPYNGNEPSAPRPEPGSGSEPGTVSMPSTAPGEQASPNAAPATASTPPGAPHAVDEPAPRAERTGPEPDPSPRPVRPAAPRFRLESGTPAPETDAIREPKAVTVPDSPPQERPRQADDTAGIHVQPVPKTSACALPPERGIARERDWLRRMFSEQYNDTAGTVSRVMSESPGLRGGSKTEAAEALAELVAVRLYLAGDSRGADAAVRTATPGPHVPLARCVTAGLRRLPSYRGPALLRTRLTEAERSWYQQGKVVTEWAFCHARTSLHVGPRGLGATDLLIWSMTARRTSSLDPALTDRVLFLPATAFKVLRADGNTVLMREVSPSETARDSRSDAPQTRLDEIALTGMENILEALEKAGTDASAETADPPGLITTQNTGPTDPMQGAKP